MQVKVILDTHETIVPGDLQDMISSFQNLAFATVTTFVGHNIIDFDVIGLFEVPNDRVTAFIDMINTYTICEAEVA